jgi:hypothetical protein
VNDARPIIDVPQNITLAQQSSAGDLFFQILPWLGILVGVIVVGTIAVILIRRYMDRDAVSDVGGFLLHDLRAMHARGELTDEEYEQAKAAMIGRVKEAKTADPPSGTIARKLTDDAPHADNAGPMGQNDP